MNIINIPIEQCFASDNFRLHVDKEDITTLMKAISDVGLLQPIAVQETDDSDRFDVVFGHRRLQACRLLKHKEIKASVYPKNTSPMEIRRIHLIENLIRKNPSPFEEGREFANQKLEMGYTDAQLGIWLSIPLTRVRSSINIFQQTPGEYKDLIERSGQGTTNKTGKIPATLAGRIILARKHYELSKAQSDTLYKMAAANAPVVSKSFKSIIMQIANNEKIDLNKEDLFSTQTISLMLRKSEVERLTKRYIKKKVYRNIAAIARAILNGELDERIRCKQRTNNPNQIS